MPVTWVQENGWYKYRSGPFSNYSEAQTRLQELKKQVIRMLFSSPTTTENAWTYRKRSLSIR